MFYLHTRLTLANVSSDYKHLTPNHTISFQNLLITERRDTQFKKRFRCTQPLRSKYTIIIFIYIATTIPPQLLPVRLTNIYRTHSPKLRLLPVVYTKPIYIEDFHDSFTHIPYNRWDKNRKRKIPLMHWFRSLFTQLWLIINDNTAGLALYVVGLL